MPYGHFITGLRRGEVDINRRILCTLAETEPITFKCLVDEAKRNAFSVVEDIRDISDL